MTQAIALIVHEVMDAPNHWKEKSDHITNGYYKVALDGSFYGMGDAKYQASEAERPTLKKAIDTWKEETGWKPKESESEKSPKTMALPVAYGDREKQSYIEFARAVRSNLKSFSVHRDPDILSSGLQKALFALDGSIGTENNTGNKPDAKGNGVSGA